MKDKNKKTSKTEKTKKYFYTRASKTRSIICALVCLGLFVGFFVCFMIYGGSGRTAYARYKEVHADEKIAYSPIDGIAADGKGRVYVFFSRSFEINAYSEDGKFLESYHIPLGDAGDFYDGGVVCDGGVMYAFNNSGDIFQYEDGKYINWFNKEHESEEKCNRIYELYEQNKDDVTTETGKTFKNQYIAVTDGNGNTIVSHILVGVVFSPISMIMAIIMTVATYLFVRRYNKKVRNQYVKTFFKESVIVK